MADARAGAITRKEDVSQFLRGNRPHVGSNASVGRQHVFYRSS